MNLLIKNNFFQKQNFDFGMKNVINEIVEEINYYSYSETESLELKFYLKFFSIFLIFNKNTDFSCFLDCLKDDLLLKNKGSDNINTYLILLSMIELFNLYEINFKENKKEQEIVKKFIDKFFVDHILYKNRPDFRIIVEKMNLIIYPKENKVLPIIKIQREDPNRIEKDKRQVSNLTFILNDLHNKTEFGHKSSLFKIDEDSEHKKKTLLTRYQFKYPQDNYAVLNYDITDQVKTLKNWKDLAHLINDKLYYHPLGPNFNYNINKANLGDLYDDYVSVIKKPMDLTTTYNKLELNRYKSITEYIKDVYIIFENCRSFNEIDSDLSIAANHMEDFFNLLIEPINIY
jgi:hypothetical protein